MMTARTRTLINAAGIAMAIWATLTDAIWFGGRVALGVAVAGFQSNVTFVLTTIHRDESPWMWALATVMWLLVGLYYGVWALFAAWF